MKYLKGKRVRTRFSPYVEGTVTLVRGSVSVRITTDNGEHVWRHVGDIRMIDDA